MDVISAREMVFRNEHNGRVYYQIGLSKKNDDGSYEKGYMPCRFRRGVDVPNMTKIMITKGWLDFYVKDRRTYPQVFISEFEVLDQETKNENPFDYDDSSDLPF